jgi:hypothetical protein
VLPADVGFILTVSTKAAIANVPCDGSPKFLPAVGLSVSEPLARQAVAHLGQRCD